MIECTVMTGTEVDTSLRYALHAFSERHMPGSRVGQCAEVLTDPHQRIAVAHARDTQEMLGFYCGWYSNGVITLHTLRVDPAREPHGIADLLHNALCKDLPQGVEVLLPLGKGGTSQDENLAPDAHGYALEQVMHVFIAEQPRLQTEADSISIRRAGPDDVVPLIEFLDNGGYRIIRDVHWKSIDKATLDLVIAKGRVFVFEEEARIKGMLAYEELRDLANKERGPGEDTFSLEVNLFAPQTWEHLLTGFLSTIQKRYTCIRCFSHLGLAFDEMLEQRRHSRHIFLYRKIVGET